MIRQKKTNWIIYIVGALLVIGAVYIVVHEVPMQQEHVETDVTSQLYKK